MNDYKPNSNKYKNEQRETDSKKRVEKVVKGTVRTRKKSEVRKLKNEFITEDAQSVATFIITDIAIPAAKKVLADIVTGGVNMFLFGDSRRDNGRVSGPSTSYTRYYDKVGGGGSSYRDSSSDRRSGLNFDDLVFESRGEAELVLTRMDELIETYGMATVSDLYDLVGKTCDYTYDRYGWTNLRNARAIPVRDGYILDLPKAYPIQR